MDKLSFEITRIDPDRVCVEVYFKGVGKLLGVLYFERAKRSYNRKPIGMNQWVCVDARIFDKVIYIDGLIEPKDLIEWGMKLIREAGH